MELSDMRAEINAIDAELLRLFIRRMEISESVAKYKIGNDLPVYSALREAEIIKWARDNAGIYADSAEELFSLLMELSKKRQFELGAK